MQWLFDALASVLAIFYSFIPHYGIAIILMTILVMIVVTPLTVKGTRSMMIMQQLQPELKKLQEKHKDDRQKLNEEMMAFYKEHQVNPVGGCLPLLVQAPVFIVLYQVLRGLTRRESDVGYDTGWVVGESGLGSPIGGAPDVMRDFDPAYLDHGSDLYISLSETNQMEAFGLNLAESAAQILGQSVVDFLPYLVLIAIVAVSGFVQQKQIQGRVRKDQVNPQQQMIMRVLPVVLPIISFTLQGGLVLYFASSNLFRVGQQWWISRNIYGLKRGETVDTKETAKVSPKAELSAAEESAAEAAPDEEPAEPKKATKKSTAKKQAAKKRPAKKVAKKVAKKKSRSPAKRPEPAVEPRSRKRKR